MISRSSPVAQSSDSQAASVDAAASAFLSAAAIGQFSTGVNSALLLALAERGDDVSSLALQRRLHAYAAAPRVAASLKLRRYA